MHFLIPGTFTLIFWWFQVLICFHPLYKSLVLILHDFSMHIDGPSNTLTSHILESSPLMFFFITVHKKFTIDLTITNIYMPFNISVSCIPFSDHCQLEFKITTCRIQLPTIPQTHRGFKSYCIFTYLVYSCT